MLKYFLMGTMLFTIVLVSTYDIYLSIKYEDCLRTMEQNPIGRMLIEAGGGSVAMFMALKVWGNFINVFVLVALYLWRQRIGVICTTIMTVLQLVLFYYLTWG